MSDPTQAQAEDRRAQIQARWEQEGASYSHAHLDSDLPWLLAELSRLSRVEQALREALATIATTGGRHYDGCGCSVCIARAALSASPEAQPEEGR